MTKRYNAPYIIGNEALIGTNDADWDNLVREWEQRTGRASAVTTVTDNGPTEKQAAFIRKLLAERAEPKPGALQAAETQFASATKRSASDLISALLTWPQKAVQAVERTQVASTGLDLTNLPEGRYAVPGGDTRLKLRIDHGKPGTKWDGWTFVKDAAVYGEGRRYGSQRPGGRYQGDVQAALKIILADPREAMAEYGRITGTCGRCGLKLEDEDSVRIGIGPVCRNK